MITNKSFDIYEGNLDPYLRFMHLKEIVPCGWVKIRGGKYVYSNEKKYISSKTTYSIVVD